ncbi:MAG: folylpolyglutamate synthase/dihydrofolate synthase family protein [Vicinamibacterales bacterium]
MTPRERLAELEQFGVKLGLEPITRLLDALGRPDRAAPVLHIAGTNGKGSTAAMVERALRAAGHRTGRYTSPHLADLEERFAIDGEPVDAATFDAAATEVLDTIDALRREARLEAMPTFFEATTAIAFQIFRQAGAGALVIEVGLGGRFDATNVVAPLAAAITSVDRDHEQYLGDTLTAIAGEKAGIAKPGVPLVAGPLVPEAREVVAATCARVGAPLVEALEGCTVETRMDQGHAVLELRTPERAYPSLRLALAGRHQVANAVVAVRLLEAAGARGLAVSPDAIVTGLTAAAWPARLEWIDTPRGRVLLDAAHNPAGAQALASYLSDSAGGRLPIVLAVMSDKDATGVIAALAPVAAAFVATEAPSPRSRRADTLAGAMAATAAGVPVLVEPDPARALARALEAYGGAVVAGSIFLVGALRPSLVEGHVA